MERSMCVEIGMFAVRWHLFRERFQREEMEMGKSLGGYARKMVGLMRLLLWKVCSVIDRERRGMLLLFVECIERN